MEVDYIQLNLFDIIDKEQRLADEYADLDNNNGYRKDTETEV